MSLLLLLRRLSETQNTLPEKHWPLVATVTLTGCSGSVNVRQEVKPTLCSSQKIVRATCRCPRCLSLFLYKWTKRSSKTTLIPFRAKIIPTELVTYRWLTRSNTQGFNKGKYQAVARLEYNDLCDYTIHPRIMFNHYGWLTGSLKNSAAQRLSIQSEDSHAALWSDNFSDQDEKRNQESWV